MELYIYIVLSIIAIAICVNSLLRIIRRLTDYDYRLGRIIADIADSIRSDD